MTYERLRERRSAPELLYEFVRTRFLSIVGVVIALTGLAILVGVDLSIPRWVRLVGIAAILLAPAGYMTGDTITSMLPDPEGVVLVDVDARKMDGAVWWLPLDDWHDLEVTDGELNQVGPTLYFGKEIDIEDMTAKGTWRGSMSDRELLRGLTKVYECRGQLEDDAKKGFVLETQAFSIIRSAVRDTTKTVVETFQKGTLPDDGEGIDSQIEAALDEYDLSDRFDEELSDVDELDVEGGDPVLDPDGDLADQAGTEVRSRVDSEQARRDAQQEVTGDD